MGVELVNEKELVLIVSRTAQKNAIMKAIMDKADPKAGAIVFSLPVTDTAGLRLLEEERTSRSNAHKWMRYSHVCRQRLDKRGFFRYDRRK